MVKNIYIFLLHLWKCLIFIKSSFVSSALFYVKLLSVIFCYSKPEQMLEVHRGQGMDIYWRDAVHCPTEEEYKAMVIRSKTTSLN